MAIHTKKVSVKSYYNICPEGLVIIKTCDITFERKTNQQFHNIKNFLKAVTIDAIDMNENIFGLGRMLDCICFVFPKGDVNTNLFKKYTI